MPIQLNFFALLPPIALLTVLQILSPEAAKVHVQMDILQTPALTHVWQYVLSPSTSSDSGEFVEAAA